jgi:hypothetical protein
MTTPHDLYKKDNKMSFPLRLQKLSKLWQKKNDTIQKHQLKVLKLWASGFFDDKYSREHLINLIDRGVFTIVPYLVEGNPKAMVETLASNYRSWAYTTQLALNFLIEKMSLAENVFIPAAINSMFGAGITRIFTEYDRTINLDDEVIKSGTPVIKVIHDSDYIGDPIAKTRSDFIFEGDVYKLPTEYAKDLFAGKDKYGNQIADYITADCKLASDFSPENLVNPNFNIDKYAAREFTTFIDIYLYDENTTVTIMPEGKKAKILREVEEDGPKESPYDYLGYKYFPGSSVPIPPAWFWHDQDVSMNVVAKTAREQAESQKDIVLVSPAHKKTGELITNAKNMDVMVVQDPNDGVNKLSLGGMNTESLGWMNFVEILFNKSGGTSEIMGGRGVEAPTLGQEKMMFQNASRIVNNMYNRYHEFMTSVIKKLAWKVWTDPTVYVPVIKKIPGLGELPEVFSQADKVGDFYDFVFRVVPYSTQRMSPEMKYQRLLQLATQWILPTLPMAAEQGAEFDVPEATQRLADYLGFEDFSQLYRTAIPKETDVVPYQMQPTKNQGQNKSPGQMSDALGASYPSREANSQRQENLVALSEPLGGTE